MHPTVRSALVVASTAAAPLLAVACGGLIDPDSSSGSSAMGAGSTSASTSSSSPTTSSTPTSTTPTASAASDRFGKTSPGSGGHPCTASTTAYYTAPAGPTDGMGCRELYRPDQKVPTGTIISIVAPWTPAGTCVTTECICGASGAWEPSSYAGCRW